MKKLLSLIGTIGLATVPVSPLVSCRSDSSENYSNEEETEENNLVSILLNFLYINNSNAATESVRSETSENASVGALSNNVLSAINNLVNNQWTLSDSIKLTDIQNGIYPKNWTNLKFKMYDSTYAFTNLNSNYLQVLKTKAKKFAKDKNQSLSEKQLEHFDKMAVYFKSLDNAFNLLKDKINVPVVEKSSNILESFADKTANNDYEADSSLEYKVNAFDLSDYTFDLNFVKDVKINKLELKDSNNKKYLKTYLEFEYNLTIFKDNTEVYKFENMHYDSSAYDPSVITSWPSYVNYEFILNGTEENSATADLLNIFNRMINDGIELTKVKDKLYALSDSIHINILKREVESSDQTSKINIIKGKIKSIFVKLLTGEIDYKVEEITADQEYKITLGIKNSESVKDLSLTFDVQVIEN